MNTRDMVSTNVRNMRTTLVREEIREWDANVARRRRDVEENAISNVPNMGILWLKRMEHFGSHRRKSPEPCFSQTTFCARAEMAKHAAKQIRAAKNINTLARMNTGIVRVLLDDVAWND